RHGEFLSLKELHRLPPLPQDQTSERLRYLTATTTAAQRLRAVGGKSHLVDCIRRCLYLPSPMPSSIDCVRPSAR
ncbi:hypothetical protein, partial [Sphingomonas sp. PP-CE-3G-477]|uniref:hypothetical protein n=1 Tax=Sphingomonas sp. PP-CE-3G-477 TaxID=2135660 RepID=UPI001C634D21